MSCKELHFSDLDALAHTYPRATVPMLPVLSWSAMRMFRQPATSRFLQADACFLRSGRIALAHVFAALDIGPNDQILLPAYHCGSMVEPAMWRDADLDFYAVDAALNLDLADIRRRLTPRTRAIVATHYFGFPQPSMAALRSLCDDAGVTLIEDCAHAFLGDGQEPAFGYTGHFAIASSVKFFPGTEGGVLVANGRPLPVHPQAGSWRRELKAAANILETAGSYQRLGWPGRMLNRMLQRDSGPGPGVATVAGSSAAPSPVPAWRWFIPGDFDLAGSRVNRWLLDHYDTARLIARRRAHYRQLAEALSGLRHGKVLFPELPSGVVPYVLPLVIDDPARQFPILKQRALPIWRWDEQIPTDSAISQQYRLHLLQLPVHQELTQEEIGQLIDGFRAVLA